MEENVMRQFQVSAGLGSAALEYVKQDPDRLAGFREFMEGYSADGQLTAVIDARTIECAVVTCAGLSRMFEE